MATKDRKKLQHIHSSIADKQPTPQSLEVGEIAVNNSANKEFLSLKNSNDKVVRFSSDSTLIDWIENKEVVPYKGYVRGEVGPSATSGDSPTSTDGHGSYGITNNDLLNNKSNLIFKINQVAAKNTVKYNKINAAKDLYNKDINPSENTPTGKTDGAGFFIDMSRYAMIGANPSFSSITVTDKSDLSGNTTIANGDGTGTRTGHTLAIKTTDVTANDTNWTETITNRTSTVTNETDKITTLNESATTRTTVVGTENLTVSGTTTETKVGNVVENHSGTTTENKRGDVTENNLANKTENTAGTHKLYTTGDTCIDSQANANFYGKVNTNIGVACDGTTKGSATTVVGTTILNMSGTTTTISGNTTNVTGATTLNLSGNTTNKRALTANTTSTSAYTSATTATTVIGTANTSATTATLSGNTLDITEATRLSAKTTSTYVSGTTLDIKENNTDIESCGRISGKTNVFTIQECATGSGKTVINQTDIKASGKTLSFDETESISAKTPTTTLSGTNLNVTETTSTINSTNTNLTGTNLSISETNTTINSCGKIEVTTDKYTLKQCNTSGGTAEFEFCNGYTVKSNAINLQQCGTAGTISISAQTQNINGGNLTINESGNTALNTTGTTNIKSTGNTNVETNGANNKVTIQASGNGGDVEVFAKDALCMSGGTTAAMVGTNKTNIGKNCADGGQTTTLNLNGTTINETGDTVNIIGSTSANVSGASVNVSGGTISATTTGKTCITATDATNGILNVGGNKATNIGVDCAGASGYSDTVGISASSAITINAPAVNITGTVYGLEDLTIQYGTNVSNRVSSTTYDGSAARTVDVPTSLADISNGVVSDTNTASTTDGCISFTKPLCVTGTITASGAIYSSDRNLKDNIQSISFEDLDKVAGIDPKSFTLKSDETHRKMYGVIAQEVMESGLDELVHSREDGTLGVDYTSYLVLKVAKLTMENNTYGALIASLNERIERLEKRLESKVEEK